MKKFLLVVLLVVFSFFSFTVVSIAGDAEDLQKLQPLTKRELYLYGKAKNNASELHKFIVTRTYLRMVNPIIGERNPKEIDERELRELPTMPQDVTPSYAVNQKEWHILWYIMLAQT